MSVAQAVVILLRIVQVALAAFSMLFVVGSLQQNIFVFMAASVFSLVLLAFIGVVQILVGGIRRRWGDAGE